MMHERQNALAFNSQNFHGEHFDASSEIPNPTSYRSINIISVTLTLGANKLGRGA